MQLRERAPGREQDYLAYVFMQAAARPVLLSRERPRRGHSSRRAVLGQSR
jgi:hypothetical protein